jgi:hypothetical protein
MVCTSDRFARRDDGKAVGLECVMTVLEEVSEANMRLDVACLHALYELSRHTFARGTADGACQGDILFACTAVEQIAAVVAEDEGTNCRHGEWCLFVCGVSNGEDDE